MKKRSVNFDQILIWAAVLCAAVLFVVQAALSFEVVRPFLSRVDRLEGDRISVQMPMYAEKPMTIREDSTVGNYYPKPRDKRVMHIKMVKPAAAIGAMVIVNGLPGANFSHGTATIDVYDGDYLEIDTAAIVAPTQFVVHVPEDVAAPVDGLLVESQGSTAVIGKVRFKR